MNIIKLYQKVGFQAINALASAMFPGLNINKKPSRDAKVFYCLVMLPVSRNTFHQRPC